MMVRPACQTFRLSTNGGIRSVGLFAAENDHRIFNARRTLKWDPAPPQNGVFGNSEFAVSENPTFEELSPLVTTNRFSCANPMYFD